MELVKRNRTEPDTSHAHDPVLKNWGFDSDHCSHCGKDNNEIAGLLLQCGKCRQAYYCSQQCFNDGLPIHRKQCTTGRLDGYAPDPTKAQKLPDPPKPVKYEETIAEKKKLKAEKTTHMAGGPAVASTTKLNDVKGMHENTAAPKLGAIFCSEAAKTDHESDHVLAMSYDVLTEEDIDNFLVRAPGPIFPCRCAKHCGIHSKDPSAATQSWSCPECNAHIAHSDVATELSDGSPKVIINCPECMASFTVPRIQINDATDVHCPRKPSRSVENESTGSIRRPDQTRSEGDSPPRFPSRCPECDACISWPTSESDSIDGSSIRCPECDAKIIVPRIQINDAVDESAPRRPLQSIESQPPKMPTRCPDCDAYISLTESPRDGIPILPKRCPECDAPITVPRIQINDAVDERKPKKPARSQELGPPRLPTRCPECNICIKWPVIESDKRDGAPMKPVRCPDCDTLITVPRVQFNNVADEKAPKKPNRFGEDEEFHHLPSIMETENQDHPPRMPVRCKDCNGLLTWSGSDMRKASPFANVRSPPRDVTENMLRSNDSENASLQDSITLSEDDDFVDRVQEGYPSYYEVVLKKLEPIENKCPRSYIPRWTIALQKIDSYRMQHSGTASFDISHSSTTISTVDLRKTEIQKRDFGWEKPEWVTCPSLRKTDVGEVLHSCGKLEKGITEIKNEAKALPEWATIGPRLRKTASYTQRASAN